MDALKRSAEPVAMRVLFDIFGRTPKTVVGHPVVDAQQQGEPRHDQRRPVRPHTLYVAGVPIERVMFWVPHPGEHLGMGISILSYCGFATLAIVADAHLVPDPETITRQFEQEFVTLLSAARRAAGRGTAAGRSKAAGRGTAAGRAKAAGPETPASRGRRAR